MDIGNAASLIQQSVNLNNQWSAQQAAKQMEFQERMSNTAHQREIADLKASGLNPVLSAKLGGASTPSGAMGDTDNSGTGALIELLEMSMETASAAAGAARSAASAVEDNAASNVENATTTADVLGMELGEDGKYHFTKEGSKQLRDIRNNLMNIAGAIPIIGSTAKKVIKFGFDHAESGLNALNSAYTFNSSRAAQLEANRRRLLVENYKATHIGSGKSSGGR